ncbi:MAG TPA: aminoacyl--tRNA ligase-related protein [Rugosimonospora sp.]|nr:aminoacyl--tRNA ligase-related protein [Rugosimonospora sp.]
MTETVALREPAGLDVAGADGASDRQFRRLVAGDWLLPGSVPGLLSFTPKFEAVLARLQAALTATAPGGSPGPAWHAPVVPRVDIDRAEYAESFPHLLGVVYAHDPDAAAGAPVPADVVLAPAVCYSVYARLANQVIAQPREFDVAGYCYRHEATSEVGRFRSFRMREFVTVGSADSAWQWRDSWIPRTEALLRRFGLACTVERASDPFFGPGGRFMRSSQVQQNLKYEFVVPVYDGDPGTAIASANGHKDHLGQRFGIGFAGEVAHSSCMAFGLERTVLALVHAHGDDPANWPDLSAG